MYYVYVLISLQSEKLYIGQTNNIDKRILRHNSNKVKSTKNRGPWKLLFKREFEFRSEAMKFEKYLKSLKNKNYILRNFVNPEKSR